MRSFVVVLVLVCAGVADADEPGTAAQALALFEEGRALLAAGKPEQACAKFESVLKLEHEDLGAILNLGLCNEQLDRLATALRWFRRAQVRASELQLAESETAAKAKTGALAGRVPTLALAFAKRPAALVVTIDGARVDEIDFQRLELDAGRHVIVAAEPGGPQAVREVVLADGERQTVELVVPNKPQMRTRLVEVDRGTGRRKTAIVVGAAGGAVVAGVAVFALVARSAANATEHPDEQRRWQRALRYGGTSAFLAGAGAIGAAAWLYFRAPGKELVERTVMIVTPEAIGAGVSGAF